MRKSKKFAVTRVRKNQKLVIIQARYEQDFYDLLRSADLNDLAKRTGKEFIVLSKDFRVVIK